MRIYVASSWRNEYQSTGVAALREYGHEVYDFRNPAPGNHGFHWSEIDPSWESWSVEDFLGGLQTVIAAEGFVADKDGMDWADACVLLLPCGRSAHLEAGYMAGRGKMVIPLFLDEQTEPELMYLLLSTGATSLTELLIRLAECEGRALNDPSSADAGVRE